MMITVNAQPYPELRQLFGAYLNSEFVTRYHTVARAVAAYRAETGPGHRSAARAELDRLTAEPGAVLRLHERFSALGCEADVPNAGVAWQLAATIRRALAGEDED